MFLLILIQAETSTHYVTLICKTTMCGKQINPGNIDENISQQ